jgi:hypothetical protein
MSGGGPPASWGYAFAWLVIGCGACLLLLLLFSCAGGAK